MFENNISIEDKLYKLKYTPNDMSHLKLSKEVCIKCEKKVCLNICPANVYSLDDNTQDIIVSHEKCLECGACKIICKSISWQYPEAGYGVSFKFG